GTRCALCLRLRVSRSLVCGWRRAGCRGGGSVFYFFFFQAEDGIRDLTVTGVQTCALPISEEICLGDAAALELVERMLPVTLGDQIGRASCRERVEMSVGAGAVKKKEAVGHPRRHQLPAGGQQLRGQLYTRPTDYLCVGACR